MVFETLAIRKEGAAVFVEIAAPPMNLLGPDSSAIWPPSFNKLRPTIPSGCSYSRVLTGTISSPTLI